MAVYTKGTSDGLTKKLYSEKLFREMEKELYFKKFMGTIVNVKMDLTRSKGDAINFGLGMRLTDSPISGELSAVEGNEEAVVDYNDTVTINIYTNAVRYGAHLSEQRASFQLSSFAEDALRIRVAEAIDQQIFDALDSPDAATIVYTTSGGTDPTYHSTAATALTAVGDTDTLRRNVLTKIRPFLKTGNSRGQAPIRPVRVDGRDYYVVLQHPNAVAELKQSNEYTQLMRDAEIRGKSNPLFTGAVAVLDGFIIHEHENVPIDTGGGSTNAVSKGYILGKDALCFAWAKKPWVVKETHNYGKEVGEAIHWMSGVTAPVFNSKPYGFIGYYVGYAADYAGATIS